MTLWTVGFAFVSVILVGYVALLIGSAVCADRRLRRWASATGIKLVRFEQRTVRAGPYFLNVTKLQVIYRVTATNPTGTVLRGFVRVGGPFAGMLSDAIEVTWDIDR